MEDNEKVYVKTSGIVIKMETEDGYIVSNENNLDDEWFITEDYFIENYTEKV